jgi:hypothetical protein
LSSELLVISFIVGLYGAYALTVLRPDDILISLGTKLRYEFYDNPFTMGGYVISFRRCFNPWVLTITESLFPLTPWLIPKKSELRYFSYLLRSLCFARMLQSALFALLIGFLPYVCYVHGLGILLLNLIFLIYVLIIFLLLELYYSPLKKRVSRGAFFKVSMDSIFCPPLAIHATQRLVKELVLPFNARNFILYFESENVFSTSVSELRKYIEITDENFIRRPDYVSLSSVMKDFDET